MFLAAVNSVHAASARVVSVEPLLQKAFRLRCRLRIHNAGAQNNAGAKVQVPASPAQPPSASGTSFCCYQAYRCDTFISALKPER